MGPPLADPDRGTLSRKPLDRLGSLGPLTWGKDRILGEEAIWQGAGRDTPCARWIQGNADLLRFLSAPGTPRHARESSLRGLRAGQGSRLSEGNRTAYQGCKPSASPAVTTIRWMN